MSNVFKSFGRKISDAAKSTAKKSEELIETSKLRSKIKENESEIEKLKKEIGEAAYAKFVEGVKIFDEAEEMCESIKGFEEKIAEIEVDILSLRRIRVCPSCQTEVEETVVFCSNCGHKFEPLPEPEVEEEETEVEANEGEVPENVCPSCGEELEEGAAFCPSCGTKIE